MQWLFIIEMMAVSTPLGWKEASEECIGILIDPFMVKVGKKWAKI